MDWTKRRWTKTGRTGLSHRVSEPVAVNCISLLQTTSSDYFIFLSEEGMKAKLVYEFKVVNFSKIYIIVLFM